MVAVCMLPKKPIKRRNAPMKTNLKRVLVFFAAALMLVSLVSCGSAADKIKKNFEKANYDVVSLAGTDENAKKIIAMLDLTEEQEKDIEKYEIIVCNEKEAESTQGGLGGFLENLGNAIDGALPDAVILKFPSAADLKDFMTVEKSDGTKDTSAYDKAKDNGLVNGNCWLIVGGTAEKDLFN